MAVSFIMERSGIVQSASHSSRARPTVYPKPRFRAVAAEEFAILSTTPLHGIYRMGRAPARLRCKLLPEFTVCETRLIVIVSKHRWWMGGQEYPCCDNSLQR